MSQTQLNDISAQIGTKWSTVFMNELRESFLLPSLVSKEYQGDITGDDDTVRVSQINAPSSDLKTIGTDEDSFVANKLSTSYVDVKVDKRAVSAYKFNDLIELQSIINPKNDPQIRQSLMQDIGNQINDYLYSVMIPSTSAPDHTINSTAAMSNTIMANMRETVAIAKWPKTSPWYHLMGPNYYSDFLSDNNLVADTYGFEDGARISGQLGQKRYGFINYEDDSVALATSSMSFLPEAVLYVQQYEPRIKISDLHPLGQFGYLMSIDLCFGAKLSINGASKCYKVTSAS